MQLAEGSVVKSIAGHDRGIYSVVVGFEKGFPVIADGKLRKIEKPKRKNPKHLIVTTRIVLLSEKHSNRALREELWPYQPYGGAMSDA